MQFFSFTNSSSPDKIGRRSAQTSALDPSTYYDDDDAASVFNASPWEPMLSSLKPPKYVLHGHAKRTDLLSQGFHSLSFLLISDRLKSLLETFRLPTCQTFETQVFSKSTAYKYHLFYLPENNYQYIDFARSTFALVRMSAGSRTPVSVPDINSLEDFEKWTKEYRYLIKFNPKGLKVAVNKLVLDTENIPYDMFRIIGPVTSYFVSESLKHAIEESGMTGMDFIPLEEILTVIPAG